MSELRLQQTQRQCSGHSERHKPREHLLSEAMYSLADPAKNELTDDGLTKLISCNKSLDVLLIDRNKVEGQKDRFKKKDLFLFY